MMPLKKRMMICLMSLCLVSLACLPVNAQITVQDDLGRTVVVDQPVKKIISLAPHVTELLYEAGAAEQLVAAVSFSDYPPAAKQLPRVGNYHKFDLESIVAFQPDLIVAWQEGNPAQQLEAVKKLGFTMYMTEPRTFEDVSSNIRRLGKLVGTEAYANQRANDYEKKYQALKQRYAARKKISVFYQVWNEPLYTVNGEHLISQVIKLCGGENVFNDLSVLSPRVSIEAVLEKNPQVIIAGMAKGREHWLPEWQRWKGLQAVKNQRVHAIHADLIVRHTPRILLGAEALCQYLDIVRAELKQ